MNAPRGRPHKLRHAEDADRFVPDGMSGLIVLLATNHPRGDFGYCSYEWTPEEVERYNSEGLPPRAAHHLPAAAEIVPVYVYTQHAETGFQGPNLKASRFRRLNPCEERRLVFWDIGGPDTTIYPLPLAVVPSDHFQPTEAQVDLLNSNLKKSAERKGPNVSSVLKTGLFLGEYQIGTGGVLGYEESTWSGTWQLLDRLSQPGYFEHPRGHIQATELFRHVLRDVHQKLQQQHQQCDPADTPDDALEE